MEQERGLEEMGRADDLEYVEEESGEAKKSVNGRREDSHALNALLSKVIARHYSDLSSRPHRQRHSTTD